MDHLAMGWSTCLGPFTLPWPPVALSPNDRSHWRVKRTAVKECRDAAVHATRSQVAPDQPIPEGMRLVIRWNPPDHRAYDLDNLLSRSKALLDGLCRGLGLDRGKWGHGDAAFGSVLLRRLGPPVRRGLVTVWLEPDPDDLAFGELGG